MLDKEPRPDLGTISCSEWLDQNMSYAATCNTCNHECDTLSKTTPLLIRFVFELLPQIQTASYSKIHTHLALLDLICHSFVA